MQILATDLQFIRKNLYICSHFKKGIYKNTE